MDLLLTAEELTQLTGYAAQARQCAALQELRIPYKINTRKQLCVARAAVEKWLGVTTTASTSLEEPDFSVFQ